MINIKSWKNDISFFLEKQKTQNNFYKPSKLFWENRSLRIYKSIIKKNNINKFRSLTINIQAFIPTYKVFFEIKKSFINFLFKKFSLNNRKKKFISTFFSGYQAALADYRTFKASIFNSDKLFLSNFSESKYGKPIEQFKFDNKNYSRASLNYLRGMSFLQTYAKNFRPRVIMEIGGGYGTLGEILKFSNLKNFKYINIDIVPGIFIAQWYLSKVFKLKKIQSLKKFEKSKVLNINKLGKLNFLCPWHIEKLRGKICLFVNFISFQEMEPEIVNNYLTYVVKLKPKYILLRNLREEKSTQRELWWQKGAQPQYQYYHVIKSIKKNLMKTTSGQTYIKFLDKEYKLVNSDIHTFGEKKYDGFNSEILLFKRKSILKS